MSRKMRGTCPGVPIALLVALLSSFVAVWLLLIVSLSVPIINTVDLLKLTRTITEGPANATVQATRTVDFGIWGYCINAAISTEMVQCTKAGLGFTFDQTVQNAFSIPNISSISDDVSSSVTSALVLHPIVFALATLARTTVPSIFFTHFDKDARPTFSEYAGLVGHLLAALLGTVAALIDIIFVAVVRHRINAELGGQIKATWGSGTWMTLTAAILLWVACICTAWDIFSRRMKHGEQTLKA